MILEVKELSKSFSGLQAVKKVNFGIPKGQICSLIGPNGAGKTTLFNLISKILEPDEGKILFRHEDITKHQAWELPKRGLARSFQIVNVFPKLTLFENVHVSVLCHERKSLNPWRVAKKLFFDQTMEILETVDLSGQMDLTPEAISHGEKKRLEVGITLGSNPQLIMLDEPTAGLSPAESQGIMNLIRQLARDKGLTVFFTEHDMDMVFSASERIIVLHNGELIADGRPEEISESEKVQQVYLGEGVS